MARLQPVPDAPPRALGLIRVSLERDEMVSPELQRTAIEDHCTRRGYVLAGWVEGLDESGSQRRSKWWARLDDAVTMVEQGEVDVLVVWRFSRTARQRLRWAVAIDRVEVAGGILESANEPLDTSTASGRLARGMLAEMAAYEAEVIGNTWREVHARRTSRGLPANGKPRFGYVVVDGIHRPDPVTGPVLAELYRRYIAGEGFFALAAWLNDRGIRTVDGYSAKGGGRWALQSVRSTLDRGFGAGFITVHEQQREGTHEPVIDRDTWDAYLATRARRRVHRSRRAERSPYLLSGMVRCGCGSRMTFGTYGRTRHRSARCVAAAAPGGVKHPNAMARVDRVEAGVYAWLVELRDSVEKGTTAAIADRARVARRGVEVKVLERELLKVDEALTNLAVNQARDGGVTPPKVWVAARDELAAERKRVDEQLRVARVESRDRTEPALVAAELIHVWTILPVAQLRGGLHRLIDHVVVTTAPGGDVTVDVVAKF